MGLATRHTQSQPPSHTPYTHPHTHTHARSHTTYTHTLTHAPPRHSLPHTNSFSHSPIALPFTHALTPSPSFTLPFAHSPHNQTAPVKVFCFDLPTRESVSGTRGPGRMSSFVSAATTRSRWGAGGTGLGLCWIAIFFRANRFAVRRMETPCW